MIQSKPQPLPAVELNKKYHITRPELIECLNFIIIEDLDNKNVLEFYETINDIQIHNLADKITHLPITEIPVICYKNVIFEVVYHKGITPTAVRKNPSDFNMLFRVIAEDFALNPTVLIYPHTFRLIGTNPNGTN